LEALSTLPLAGVAVVAGGSATAAAQTRASDEVAAQRVTKSDRVGKKQEDSKNKGWCTQDLYFDQEGCLFIANAELAREIQDSLNAWGGRLCMSRRGFCEEKDACGGPVEGNKVNMLCPC
jgi:hypothetical protein